MTNGIGGYASGTVAGLPTRRYHGLLVAALQPPLGRTVLLSKLDETATYNGRAYPLFSNRWGNGAVEPAGYHHIERFRLEDTTPTWSFACADALLEKRVWMRPGANTTYIRYDLCRASAPLALSIKALVNTRDYHALTRGGDWQMAIQPVAHGLRVTAFEGAAQLYLLSAGADARPERQWYRGYFLRQEAYRGLDALDDNLYAGEFTALLQPGESLTLVASTEPEPNLDGDAAYLVRQDDEGFYPHPDLTQPLNRIRAWADATTDPVKVSRFGLDDRPIWPEWATRHNRQWHGAMTSVAAAGNGERSHGLYRGPASDAEVVLIQVENDAQGITDEAIVRALRWTADHAEELGIRVVSRSIGAESNFTPPGNPIDVAVRDLVAQGVIVVAAAGNDAIRWLAPPASAPEALTVGGLDDRSVFSHEEIALWHSNYGITEDYASKPELVAPSIWVAAPVLPGSWVEAEAQQLFVQRHRGPDSLAVAARIAELKLITPYYQHVDGTSFAAPVVASVVACMLEANSDLSPSIVRQMLLATAQPVPGATRERQGDGALSAGQAVARASSHRHPELVD